MATITYHGKTIPQKANVDLLGQLLDVGLDVQYICMSGSCGTCKVRILRGMEHLSPKGGMEFMLAGGVGERLSCQAVCLGTGDIEVEQ